MERITINGRLARVLRTVEQRRGQSEVFVCPMDDNKPHARHMLPTAWVNDPKDKRVCITGGNSYGKVTE